jgi:uncharacterized protein
MTRGASVTRRWPWSAAVLSALLAAGSASGLAAAPPELPPVVQPASGEYHPGKVIWTDLVTPDLAGAKRFYGGLFGWTFDDLRIGDADYAVAMLDGSPVAGVVQRPLHPGEQRQPYWLTFFAVRDARGAARAIQADGGMMLSPLRDHAQRGRQAVFRDPQGAVFAILQSSSGDPPDVLAAPSDWIWSALITRDPDTDAAFYQKVFGYEVFEMPENAEGDGGDGAEHLVLSSDQFARASVNPFPGRAAGAYPHWIDLVRVGSAADAAARAKQLGGRVLVEPHRGRSGNIVALLADPAGAPFGVMEWTGTQRQEAK